ncbi:hypothetical protein ACJ41O_006167 [Fusarium nematophilum]
MINAFDKIHTIDNAFGIALEKGDLPMAKACLAFGLATTNDRFPLQRRDAKGQSQTCLVKVLEAFHQDRISSQVCYETLQWLLDTGADPTLSSPSDLTPAPVYYATSSPRPVIDHLTEMMKWAATRSKMDALCGMAELLCAWGAVIDLHQGRFRLKGERDARRRFQMDRAKRLDNAVEIALLPHCPPSFLGLLLDRHFNGFSFTERNKAWHLFGAGVARDQHFAESNLEWIITRMHRDLFERSNYRGYRYTAEIPDSFDEKITLMARHGRVVGTEILVLRKVADVVREIQTALRCPVSDLEQYTAHSWYKLCMSASGLAQESYVDSLHPIMKSEGNARHGFKVSGYWDARNEMVRQRFERLCAPESSPMVKKLWWQFLAVWQKCNVSNGARRPWHEVEEDKWMVPIEEAWAAFNVSNAGAAALLKI